MEKIADWIVCQPKGQLRIIQQNIFGEKFSTDLCRQLELLLNLRSVCVGVQDQWQTEVEKMDGFKDANLREGLKERVGGVFSG